MNKQYKKNKAKFTVTSVSVIAENTEVSAKAKISKKGKIKNLKYVKVKTMLGGKEKVLKLKKDQYKLTVKDAEAKLIHVELIKGLIGEFDITLQ